jgi:hypothetical protein
VGADTLRGGDGNDLLGGGTENDLVLGDAGNDTIFGGTGDDSLSGGADNDRLLGEGGNDNLQGDGGDDSLRGGSGDDNIDGGGDADSLFGDAGNDTLLGGSGNDQLFGGADDDSMAGGNNDDTLEGGSGDDTLKGDIGADSLSGDAGDDSLDGGSGNDTLLGGSNNDVLLGSTDDDSLVGGTGNDQLFGGSENDTLHGEDGNDALSGGGGDDVLFGGAGIDTIEAGGGDDSIFGGSGDDSLFGEAGNDTFGYEVGDLVDDGAFEFVDGGGNDSQSITTDNDILDLSEYGNTFGWSSVVIVRDNLDPNNPQYEDGFVYLFAGPAPALPIDPNDPNIIGVIRFFDIERVIPCFTPGTMILTDRGERPVEDLVSGDLVMTRDSGLQPLRWVGHRHLSQGQLVADPDLHPVRIAKGALGSEGPVHSMMVSPQHRVLLTGARAELLFGTDEVLVPAKHLVGQTEATRVLPEKGVTYIHILFDRHEIVQSDGIWTESFQPAERSLNAMEAAVRDEILKIFPELATDTGAYDAARLSLKAHEARVLLAR